MKCVPFLYTQSDSTKAEKLRDFLPAKLGSFANVKNIRDMIAGIGVRAIFCQGGGGGTFLPKNSRKLLKFL